MSRRRALRYRLAAYRARLRPGTTAELASLVLRMSDEIDTRERMLDAALGQAGRGPDGVGVGGFVPQAATWRPEDRASADEEPVLAGRAY